MRNKMKSDIYKYDFNKLTIIINEWDPVGLIQCGAPDDEYSCLVDKIISLLYNFKSKDDFHRECHDFIRRHFGFEYDYIPEQYRLNAFKHEEESIDRIIKWFLEKSLYNNNYELALYVINKEIREFENSCRKSETYFLFNEISEYQDIKFDGSYIRVLNNSEFEISYNVSNLLWKFERICEEELYFGTLKELMLYAKT